MKEKHKIVKVEKPEWEIIGGGIHNFNIEQAGEDNAKSISFIIQGSENEIIGGLIGSIHWNWLYIDLMWITEEFRGQGYGKQLLFLAEDEARKLGAVNSYLDTFSFQAPAFYKKFGYKEYGVLKDFPTGHHRCYLTKQL